MQSIFRAGHAVLNAEICTNEEQHLQQTARAAAQVVSTGKGCPGGSADTPREQVHFQSCVAQKLPDPKPHGAQQPTWLLSVVPPSPQGGPLPSGCACCMSRRNPAHWFCIPVQPMVDDVGRDTSLQVCSSCGRGVEERGGVWWAAEGQHLLLGQNELAAIGKSLPATANVVQFEWS